MGLLIMMNSQIGISSFGKNETFSLDYRCQGFPLLKSCKPLFGAHLKSKNVKRVKSVVVRKSCCGRIYAVVKEDSDKRVVGSEGGAFENEFEFKPSFSEYLKAMESVKSNQGMQQASKLGRDRMRDALKGKYMSKTMSLGRDDENVKLMDEKAISKNVGCKELGKFHHEGNVIRKTKDKFSGNESWVDAKVKRTLKGERDGRRWSHYQNNTVDPELKNSYALKGKYMSKTTSLGRDDENVKLMDEKVISEDVKCEELGRNGDGVAWGEGADRGKLPCKGSVIRKSKDKFSGNESWVDVKVKRTLKGETGGRRWSRYQNNTVEPELKDSYSEERKKLQKARDNPVVLLNDNRNASSGNITADLVQGKISSEMFGTKGENFENDKVAARSHVVRNHIRVQETIAGEYWQRSEKLTYSRKYIPEKDDDRSWEMERAAFKFVEEGNDFMDKPRVARVDMEERIQKLARQLNGTDIDVPEWMFSKMMRSARIRFSDHSILRVIQILGKLRNWRRVLQVIEWLQMRERFKSHRLKFIYTTALNVLGKARRPVEALNVFHAMQQQISSYPDLVAYHSIAVTLGQAGHIRELFYVIDTMRSLPKKKFRTGIHEGWDPRLEPNIVVYNAVLNACVKRKNWEGAFWVLQQIKEKGQKPSASTYGLVMEVMLACGKYNLVHEFFRKVQKSFIPNALVYKVLVNTLWREGKIDEAVLAVQDMERQGIVGSAALYYDLARCLCSAGRCQEALMQIEKICKVANKPLVVTYTGLIQACLDSGNIENAAEIFNQMKDFCSPNLVTCNIMLKAYLENGFFEEAKKLFQRMSEDSSRHSWEPDNRGLVVPDIYTFNTMLDACIVEKRWDDLEHVYKKMLQHGFHFNAKRHVRIILDASRAGRVELLETAWKHLVQANRVPPPPLIKERFRIFVEKEDYISALSCITSHPVSDLPEFSKTAWMNLFKENSRGLKDDTFVQLIHGASIQTTRIDSVNSVLHNLISSCKEFLRTHTRAPKMIDRQTLNASA
ncbi:pentatricopeptide repeat-containing protein At1g30610, chloroplastic-like [Mangifera indica]|uniref:pentatricopeptide repeat-containing protein At1g30610, chloroplastic-like n=1 Tax=Mangifera indica TaxID=29780 RepID=UPI001CF998D1|nr:pentatricopeptide repeat-containing protein At1g30610, chloroplastic-like [Mangifera indica]